MSTMYVTPGVEVLGHLHDLTLASSGSCKVVGPKLGKMIAPKSDGAYCTSNRKVTPLHS